MRFQITFRKFRTSGRLRLDKMRKKNERTFDNLMIPVPYEQKNELELSFNDVFVFANTLDGKDEGIPINLQVILV